MAEAPEAARSKVQELGSGVVRALLITDLAGSTATLERLGDEAGERSRQSHHAQMSAIVVEHDGSVFKDLGDGLAATFSSAQQAVRCSIAMQRADRDSAGGNRLRIGIEVGEPYQDATGDFHGMCLVVASRLCNAAGGGEILVSDVVARLVSGRFPGRFKSLGQLRLKGLSTPMAAWHVGWGDVLDASSASDLTEASLAPSLPRRLGELNGRALVGRDAELAWLLNRWQESQESGSRFCAVTGGAGAGKSRLTAAVAARCFASSATLLYGECEPDTQLFLQPWSEALTRDSETRPPRELRRLCEGRGELARVIPGLRERVPELPSPVIDDPEGQRGRLYDAILRYLKNAAQSSPMLIVLEDLHWADEGTLQLLGFLHRRLESSHVMILATLRETETDERLRTLLTELSRRGDTNFLDLPGLSSQAVAELARDSLGKRRVTDELVNQLLEHTEGNPLFVEEVLRALKNDDGSLDSVAVPPTVEATLDRAIHLLAPEAADMLAVAAVAGPSFDLTVVADAAGVDDEVLLRHLESAAERRLIVEDAITPGRFAFTHALVRKVLLNRVGRTRLARFHLQLAEVLERRSQMGGEVDPTELARHFLAAGDQVADRASVHAEAAGMIAMERLGHAQAAEFFSAALRALDLAGGKAKSSARRGRLLVLIGEAATRAGRVAHAADMFAVALREAQAQRDPLLAAAVARGISGGWTQPPGSRYPDLIEALKLSTELLDENDPMRVHLEGRLAAELRHELSAEQRHALTIRALEQARQGSDARLLAEAIVARHWVCLPEPFPEVRLALLEELISTATAAGDREALLEALFRRHSDLKELGEVSAATEALRQYANLASELEQPFFIYTAALAHAAHLMTTGTISEAQEALDVALKLYGTVDPRPQLQEALEAIMAVHLVLSGQHEVFAAASEGAIRDNVCWAAGRAWALAECGRIREARELIAAGEQAEFVPPGEPLITFALGLWTRAAFKANAASVAHRLEERLLPFHPLWIQLHFGGQHLGPVILHLGLLNSLKGDHERALENLAEAARAAQAVGSGRFVQEAQTYAQEVSRRMHGSPAVARP